LIMSALLFIHDLKYEDLPAATRAQAKRCLLDLVGVAASGLQTSLSGIVRDFAHGQMAPRGPGARMIFDGRRVSPSGAAFAGASTIDAFDAHDGHALTKGHAGVAILPALLATADATRMRDGRAFLANLVLGYEIATRAGIALHASASDYHTSGAWNALGCAAVVARMLGLDEARTRHALGIAEYHGPRSQMMRCIAHPTMLKDGSGVGAFVGVSSAYLARDGFTGAPAVTLESPDQASVWSDLGTRWRIEEQYFKPYPVCRWAQPAIDAAANLVTRHRIEPHAIVSVRVGTFAHAVELGARIPATTEEAQYAIGFPLAAFLVRGQVGAAEITGEGLRDPAVLDMTHRIALIDNPAFTQMFPARRVATVAIACRDGSIVTSEPTEAHGDPERPLSDHEVSDKFHRLAAHLASSRRRRIEDAVDSIDRQPDALEKLMSAVLTRVREPARPKRPDRTEPHAKPSNKSSNLERIT
jgi:2-methylcitrate dehydratase PrpD